jgi:hypothetical protein
LNLFYVICIIHIHTPGRRNSDYDILQGFRVRAKAVNKASIRACFAAVSFAAFIRDSEGKDRVAVYSVTLALPAQNSGFFDFGGSLKACLISYFLPANSNSKT